MVLVCTALAAEGDDKLWLKKCSKLQPRRETVIQIHWQRRERKPETVGQLDEELELVENNLLLFGICSVKAHNPFPAFTVSASTKLASDVEEEEDLAELANRPRFSAMSLANTQRRFLIAAKTSCLS